MFYFFKRPCAIYSEDMDNKSNISISAFYEMKNIIPLAMLVNRLMNHLLKEWGNNRVIT